MKYLYVVITAAVAIACTGPAGESPKAVLLQQLKKTHTEKDWFVPVNVALEGVTAEQAMWRDSSGNHSIGQLAYHLLYWNKRQLLKLSGQPEGAPPATNEETFTTFNAAQWSQTVASLDSVLTALEEKVEDADDATLRDWYPTLANINTHNAYHTGQIIYARKQQQAWDGSKGVQF